MCIELIKRLLCIHQTDMRSNKTFAAITLSEEMPQIYQAVGQVYD